MGVRTLAPPLTTNAWALTMGFESRDYARDGRYTASLSAWGMDLTPVVKYLIIANVVVFLLQILLTRPVAPEPADFDGVWPDDEQTAVDTDTDTGTEHPAPKKDAVKAVDRQARENNARKAREAMERMLAQMPGMRTSIVQNWFELDPKKTVEQGQIWRLLTSAFCHERYSLWHILWNMLFLAWFGQRLERRYGSTEFLLFYLAAGSVRLGGLCGAGVLQRCESARHRRLRGRDGRDDGLRDPLSL